MSTFSNSRYTQTVGLKNVKCFGYHGFYPQEQKIGGYFSIDLDVVFVPNNFDDQLANTVNYEELNAIILAEMQSTQKLLETLLSKILHRITNKYKFILKASVSITKLNPPMPGEVGASFVCLNYISENL